MLIFYYVFSSILLNKYTYILFLFYLIYILTFYIIFFYIYLGILYNIIFNIYFGYLFDIYFGNFSDIYSGILSQVEVQRCPLSSEGPRLRSSGVHWSRKVPVWGPVVPTVFRTLRLRFSRANSEVGNWGPAIPTARKMAKKYPTGHK